MEQVMSKVVHQYVVYIGAEHLVEMRAIEQQR